MKPIGGYLELECGRHVPRHGGVYVNSGCNALRLIVRLLKIRRIHVPNYTCPVVHKTLKSEGCEILPYELDAKLLPRERFPKDDFVLANDYFGLTGGNIAQLATEYPNLIVDNAQSYFADPLGRATIYSPRKFMGLPDGGIAVFTRDDFSHGERVEHGEDVHGEVENSPRSSCSTWLNLPDDTSYDRMSHLLKRHDLGATAAYADFKANDAAIFELPLRAMSRLTRALMGNIDESSVRSRRLANFSYLFNRLKTDFPINPLSESAPLVYPYVTHDSTLRQRLIDNQIFCPTYWPDAPLQCPTTLNAQRSTLNLIALPIDQRYDEHDMKHILEVINA